jgi:hypothetical protein
MPSPPNLGIHRVNTDEMKRLLRSLHRGVIRSPITRADLIEKAFGNQEGNLRLIVGLDTASAKALIVAVLEERAAWEHKLSRLEEQLAAIQSSDD